MAPLSNILAPIVPAQPRGTIRNPFRASYTLPSLCITPHRRTALPTNPTHDPRALAIISRLNSYEPDFDDGDDEPVVEWHVIRHIPTEYGTAVMDGRGREEVQEEAQEEQRPALRRGNAYSGLQAMLRRISWSSSFSPSPPSSSNSPNPCPGPGDVPVEASEEDPLAFAKEGPVEVRAGETEQISLATYDMRLRGRSIRESVGDWIAGLRRGGERKKYGRF